MERKTFMTISAVVAMFVGCVALFAARAAVDLINLDLNTTGLLASRALGGAIMAMSVGLWSARNDKPSRSLRAILAMWGTFHAIGLLVMAMGIIGGPLDFPLVIVPIAARSLFLIGSVYFIVKMK
jgi:hypothetical protein